MDDEVLNGIVLDQMAYGVGDTGASGAETVADDEEELNVYGCTMRRH